MVGIARSRVAVAWRRSPSCRAWRHADRFVPA